MNADPHDSQPAPALPYRVAVHRYGPGAGIERPTKVRAAGAPGELLTPDEIAVWEHNRWLKAEVNRLTAIVEQNAHTATVGEPVGAAPTRAQEPLAGATERTANAEVPQQNPTTNSTEPQHASTTETEPQQDAADKRTRAVRELLCDPGASNPVLAARANCSDEYVRRLRHQLISEGQLAVPTAPLVPRAGTHQPDANCSELPAEQAVGAG